MGTKIFSEVYKVLESSLKENWDKLVIGFLALLNMRPLGQTFVIVMYSALSNRRPVSSVSRATDCRAGSLDTGFEPQTRPTLRVLK